MKDRAYPFALPLGTDISGYVVDRVIGAGGFGITYEATNPVTGVTVAIKEFYPQGFASRDRSTVILHSDVSSGSYETALKKFEQEAAKLTGRYRHPNIVGGLNFLRMNNTAYFVMEFIEGVSLDQWLLERATPPSELELRAVFEKVFDAVDYIHANNGMHRDLTPKNIMIRSDGEPILVDFGASGEGLDTDRQESQAFAQPNYAPPEQLTADDTRMQGRHTDIFSLAGVLYRALAGRPPVKPLKRSHEVALNGREADPYIPAAQAARDPLAYSAAFLAGIDEGLRLDPRERPGSIAEFRAALGWLDDDTMMVARHEEVWPSDQSEEATRILAADAAPEVLPEPGAAMPVIVPRMDHLDEAATALAPPVALAPDEVRTRERGWGGPLALALLIVAALIAGIGFFGPERMLELVGLQDPAPPTAPAAPTPAPAQPSPAEPPAAPARTAEAPKPPPPPPPPAPRPAAEPPAVAWTDYADFALAGRETATRTTAADGPEACRALCRDDRSCQGYTAEAGGACRLYGEISGLRPEPGHRSALRSTAPALAQIRAAAETEARRRGGFRTLEGIALAGGGVPRQAGSQAQCAFACQSDQSCKAWVYSGVINSCRLHDAADPAEAGPAVGFVTGLDDADGRLSEAARRAVTAKTRTAQAFVGADFAGRVIGREPSADGNACRQACLSDATCIAAVQAEGECTRYAQVDDIRRRPDAEALVDVRQTVLVSRVDSLIKERPAPVETDRGQADFFAGFDVVGTVMPSDRTRGATTPEECQAACSDTATCVAYSFATAERRCQILSEAVDVVPDGGRLSGIYRGVAQAVVDLARRRLVQSEQMRGNYRDLPPNCAADGASTPVALGSQPTAEQCAFLCRSGTTCQGWVYNRADRSCELLDSVTGAITGANLSAGLFDPTGRRAADIARACGPIPPAPIGGNGPVPPSPIGGAALVPPAPIGGPAPAPAPPPAPSGAAECDRAAGYLYDADLPRGVAPRQFEHIDPGRAVPACLAALATAPATPRWRLALGRALEREGREAEARAAYREAADAGSGAAAFLYAIMLDKGQGGPEDDVEAERYFRLARARGVAPAAAALALLYTYSDRVTTTNDQDILVLLTEAANRGHAPSMYRLGEAYEKGRLNRRFLPIDQNQANLWYGRAFAAFSRDADQRDPAALRFLSLLYDGGRGVPRSTEQAVRYLAQYLSIAYGPDNLVVRRRGAIGDISLDEWSVDTRRAFQQFLAQVGGFTDTVDGIVGTRTREAIERWLGLRA